MSAWLGDGFTNSEVAIEMWVTNRAPDDNAQPPLQKMKCFDEHIHTNQQITVNEMHAEYDVGVH